MTPAKRAVEETAVSRIRRVCDELAAGGCTSPRAAWELWDLLGKELAKARRAARGKRIGYVGFVSDQPDREIKGDTYGDTDAAMLHRTAKQARVRYEDSRPVYVLPKRRRR